MDSASPEIVLVAAATQIGEVRAAPQIHPRREVT
jgi:hypothetical protein